MASVVAKAAPDLPECDPGGAAASAKPAVLKRAVSVEGRASSSANTETSFAHCNQLLKFLGVGEVRSMFTDAFERFAKTVNVSCRSFPGDGH